MGAPLTGQDMTKLMRIYDKKGEGHLDWDDLISEHKYINVVRKRKRVWSSTSCGCGCQLLWVWSLIVCGCGHYCTEVIGLYGNVAFSNGVSETQRQVLQFKSSLDSVYSRAHIVYDLERVRRDKWREYVK